MWGWLEMFRSLLHRIEFWLRVSDIALACAWCGCAFLLPVSQRKVLIYVTALLWLVAVALVGGYRQDHLYPPRRLAVSIGLPLLLTAIGGVFWGGSGWVWYMQGGLLTLAVFACGALLSRTLAILLGKAPTYQLIPYNLGGEYTPLLRELQAIPAISITEPLANPTDTLPPDPAGHRMRMVVTNLRVDEESFARLLPLYEQVEVVDLAEFYEFYFTKVACTHQLRRWMLLTPLRVPSILFDSEKRMLDLILCLCLAPLALLLIAVGALAIRLSSPGPIFFVQERLGRFGKPFRLLKLRTMTSSAEANGQKWAESDDARITSVGRFLRASGIDELPQLWNILRGEMGLVGPRPETPLIARHLEAQIPFYQARQLVLPGLTGWAQLHQGGDASLGDVASKLRYDLYYLKYASVALDIRILLATLQMVLHMAKPAPIRTAPSRDQAYLRMSG